MWQKNFFKITKDLLISFIITYFFLLIPELVLPGIVSSHFNPKYLLIAIVLLGILYSRLGKNFKKVESQKFEAIARNLINIILFLIALMLFLSLYKMKIWEIVLVVVISIPLLLGAENILVKER
jgi:hypothetical protein